MLSPRLVVQLGTRLEQLGFNNSELEALIAEAEAARDSKPVQPSRWVLRLGVVPATMPKKAAVIPSSEHLPGQF